MLARWFSSFPSSFVFLAGVADFACRSAHFHLRSKCPSVVHSRAKRSGLRSLRDRKFSVEDTEWHLLFGRPVSEDLRSKYFDTLQKTLPPASLPN